MNFIKRFFSMLACISILGIGLAFILKASIGVAPYDAVSQSISKITSLKVGTVIIMLNFLFILGQIAIKKKRFKTVQLLQFVVIFIFGFIVNFFFYEVLKFNVNSYFIKIALFLLGTFIVSFGVAGIMNIDIVYTPLEGFLNALAEATNGNFIIYRMAFDIFSIFLTLALAYSFNIPLAIREGTIISSLIFSPIMGWFIEYQKPIFKKLGILQPVNKDRIQEQMDII